MEPTDFKNVIVENIPPAPTMPFEILSKTKATKILLRIGERAGGIFSTVTFLKSVGSTDQNAL